MEERRFNLIDEPWIPVVEQGMQPTRVSLREGLLRAEDFLAIDGETPLQSVALLRLLIALVITILSRYDQNGEEAELEDPVEAKDRWLAVFKRGQLPAAAVEAYFKKWHDCFYLLGGEHPFLQIRPGEVRFTAKEGYGPDGRIMVLRRAYDAPADLPDYDDVCSCTWNTAAQLNGAILESNNKASAVAERQGYWKNHLTDAEAAAWLVYFLDFANCGSCGKGNDRDKNKKAPDGSSLRSAEMTAASRGCLVSAEGGTLFDTLMLNSPLAKYVPGGWEMYGAPCPAWEDQREYLMKDRRPVPDDLPAVLTQLSRRILLHEEKPGVVDGFHVGMGDVWTDRGMEPMFMWQSVRDKESGKDELRPVHYKADTLEWQNCEYLFGGASGMRPAAAEWTSLRMEDLGITEPIRFRMTDIAYGTMNSMVDYTVSGFLHVAPGFFDADGILAEQAGEEMEHIEAYAKIMYNLGRNLGVAEGMDEKGAAAANAKRVKSVYYDRIGRWFLRFLTQDGLTAEGLLEEEFSVAAAICEEETAKAPPEAISGHGGEDTMTMGRAYGICRGELIKLRKKLKGD